MVVRHVFSGDYLPFLDVLAKVGWDIYFKFNTNNILIRGFSGDHISLVSITIDSKGKRYRDAFVTDWHHDFESDINDLKTVEPERIEFILDEEMKKLTIVGRGDYVVRKEIDVSEMDMFNEPDVKLTNRLVFEDKEVSKLKKILRNLSKVDRVLFLKEYRIPLRLIGYGRWDDSKKIEIELPNVKGTLDNGGTIYPVKLVKQLQYILKTLKPHKVVLRWGQTLPMLVEVQNDTSKLRYWVAPRAE